MAKRIAEKELTDRNWDQEDEGEEAGMFSIASEEVMKNRAIKKAKRRNLGAEGDSAGAFKTFKGFSLTASAPAAGATFSTFGNGAGFKPLSSLTNGSASPVIPFKGFNSTATVKTNTGTSSSNGSASSSFLDSGDIMANGSAPSLPAISGGGSSSKEYNRQLTALNCSVRDWITKHVNDNPLCDLNPIFRDYERHLATIERKYGSGAAAAAAEEQQPGKQANTKTDTTSFSTSSNVTPAAPALFSFTKNKDSAAPEKSSSIPAGVTFNFGQKVDSSVLSSLKSAGASGFPITRKTTANMFNSESTGTSTGTFSFTAAKTEAASNSQAADQNGADEETDEPPVPVVREIKEKDAFYSKKCKLFYKKENEFKEKGVGTMHLKLVSDSKLQLLVRADTNLGNILLNIMVHSSMPCTRTGKNNVMVVCVPNPPVDDKNPSTPVPMLIRVKTAEDADELHKLLQEKKA
ncbi:nuclear pore complex protein Nup50 isoform X1 [Tachysurus fulvidraco]|uniref:nuclear pore complex protein Nup50 isoform X1 n=1 Tax=Tachysurus fulvidraco TaxID=1234273 RepID=UPI000F4F3F12|nr:nuclear pore complex protein Nup50 isoform X1 [Tachysurus fulvidraco]XP_047660057.1 nuclear pore complex protein Nup50 isoform X1 [Tachysurus fulvidraco]